MGTLRKWWAASRIVTVCVVANAVCLLTNVACYFAWRDGFSLGVGLWGVVCLAWSVWCVNHIAALRARA